MTMFAARSDFFRELSDCARDLSGSIRERSDSHLDREDSIRQPGGASAVLSGLWAERPLQPPHLPLPPPIAGLVHQLPRPLHVAPRLREIPLVAAESRPFQVRIARVKPHRTALGDLQ